MTSTDIKKILVIEDEEHVISFIRKGLIEEGYEVSVAFDGPSGISMFRSSGFDCVVLDIMMSGMNGYEVCRQLKTINKKVPILFLTALGTAENIVLGLETGADDYLVKPFKFIELVARIKSLIRRSELVSEQGNTLPDSIFRIADLELNDYTKTVSRAGQVLSLTATEYRLLLYFLKNQGRVVSRTDILDEVWGVNFDMGTNVVDVYVNYLRKKLDKSGDDKLIHTVVGMGYVLKEQE